MKDTSAVWRGTVVFIHPMYVVDGIASEWLGKKPIRLSNTADTCIYLSAVSVVFHFQQQSASIAHIDVSVISKSSRVSGGCAMLVFWNNEEYQPVFNTMVSWNTEQYPCHCVMGSDVELFAILRRKWPFIPKVSSFFHGASEFKEMKEKWNDKEMSLGIGNKTKGYWRKWGAPFHLCTQYLYLEDR